MGEHLQHFETVFNHLKAGIWKSNLANASSSNNIYTILDI